MSYVCVCMCECVYVYVNVYECVWVCVSVYVCLYVCECVYMCMHMCVCVGDLTQVLILVQQVPYLLSYMPSPLFSPFQPTGRYYHIQLNSINAFEDTAPQSMTPQGLKIHLMTVKI